MPAKSKLLSAVKTKAEILRLKGFTSKDKELSMKQLQTKLSQIRKSINLTNKRGITVADYTNAYNTSHFPKKFLSKLTKREILTLDGMKLYEKLPLKELKKKLNERAKLFGLKKGATTMDFNNAKPTIPSAPENVPILPRYVDSDEYKMRMTKKSDDELFNKKLPSVRQKNIDDRTDYSTYKNTKFYQKWYGKYLSHVKKGESVEITIGDDKDKMTAFENVIRYLVSTPMQNKIIYLSSSDLAGHTVKFTLNNANKGRINTMLDCLSGRIDITRSTSGDAYSYDENSSVYYPVKASINILNIQKNGKKTHVTRKTVKDTKSSTKSNITEYSIEEWEAQINNVVSGAFWKYINNSGIDLTKYQIFSNFDKVNYKDNCFVYAAKQSGLFDANDIESLIDIVKTRDVPLKTVQKISEHFKIPIVVDKLYENSKTTVDTRKRFPDSEKCFKLLLFKDHYMIDEPVNASTFYIKNKEKLDSTFPGMPQEKRQLISRLHEDQIKVKEYNKTPTSLRLILRTIFDAGLFESIKNMETINEIGIAYDEKLEEYTDLTYKSELCTRLIDSVELANKIKTKEFTGGVFFSDFETDVTTNPHTPYLNVTISQQNKIAIIVNTDETGNNIGSQLISWLPDKSLVYFHNLKYDVCFFINSSEQYNIDIIERSGMVIQVVIRAQNKVITFRDSRALIPTKLANFAGMFNLKVHKEVMAYQLYTEVNRKRQIIPIQEYYNQLDIENKYKSESDREQLREQLLKNAIRCKSYNESDKTIDIMKYAQYYCVMDCLVLKQGIEKFDNDLRSVFIDYECQYPGIYNYLSISAVGYSLAKLYGCFDGCYELSGKPQHFIQKCINGGRTMTANNEKLIKSGKLQDFDACALYPSAMSVMPGVAKGIPKIIENFSNIMDYDDFYVEIDIHKLVPKSEHEYEFGLVWKIDENGSKIYGNDIVDNYYIDKRGLMDLTEFYDVDYTVKRGYYFNEGFNSKISMFITRLYKLRNQYKRDKNPLEQTIKLLLNSIYGKSILKPIDHEVKSISNSQLDKFIIRHYNYITSMEGNTKRTYVRMIKPINKHFNLPQFGCAVLSWSKHLMNCVMCTAEQNGIKIYYQDTDSMHLDEENVDRLAMLFEQKYDKKLIGKQLTQFHNDFDAISDEQQIQEYAATHPGFIYNVWSNKLIALGKKSYLDLLEDNIGNTGYHIRLKGIPNQCILNYCTDNGITVEELYMKLYNGETIEFDLLNGTPGFQKTTTFEQTTRDVFKRRVQFK